MNVSSESIQLPPSLPRDDELAVWLQRTYLPEQRSIVKIEKKPARRLAALVSLDDGTDLFVKKLFHVEHLRRLADENLTREVKFLERVREEAQLAAFRQVVPAFYAYFPVERILISEGLRYYTTLRDNRQMFTDTQIIQTVAIHLAQCHKTSSQADFLKQCVDIYHQEAPIPTYGHITPEKLANAPGRDYSKYVRIVQGINTQLRQLKSRWTQQCLIHGDFKFDNIMISNKNEAQKDRSVKFVDWELCGWGDPLWDVGSLVGQWLLQWSMSIHIDSQTSLQEWLQAADIPFEQVRSAVTCFVEQYIAERDQSLLEKQTYQQIVRYAGAFLLHRVLATLEIAGVLTSSAYCYLHIGRTLIAQPQLGMRLLFVTARHAS
jgi:thiamine kinase-like enzyme